MSRTLVIAEPGAIAEGDFDTMIHLIHVAKEAGADVFKNQWCSNPEKMSERRHAPEYLRFYRWLQWPVEWHARFKAECASLGLQYACSIYLPEDAATVAPFVQYLKVSSFEAGDPAIVRGGLDAKGRNVIVSTGLMSEDQFQEHLVGEYAVLHCTSQYPAPLAAIHLGVISSWGISGLSDHSRHVLTGAVAVGAGAAIIEAHYRLDAQRWYHRLPFIRRRVRRCDPKNPDYPVAFSPAEFTTYIENIRIAEAMMGSGVKQIQDCEREMCKYRVTA